MKKKKIGQKEKLRKRGDLGLGNPEDRIQPYEAGSIEQHLDMCEEGTLRGDEIDHQHGTFPLPEDKQHEMGRPGVDSLIDRRFGVDMSERDREGDEMSGDDHSAGLQGGEEELERQPHIETGLPGDKTFHDQEDAKEEAVLGRKRAS